MKMTFLVCLITSALSFNVQSKTQENSCITSVKDNNQTLCGSIKRRPPLSI